MSKNIPTAGKVWLIILLVLQVLGVIGGIVAFKENSLFIALAVISAVEAVLLFLLLKGKGMNIFIAYIVCHLVNAGTSLYLQYTTSKEEIILWAFLIGAVIGLAINFVPTYFAVRKNLKEAK